MTRRAWVFPVAIVAVTVVAAVTVLVAGGPDSKGVALALLVGVPLLIAFGGGSDYAWENTPRPQVSTSVRLMAFLPGLVAQVAVLVVIAWQVIVAVAGGDAVCAVAIVPFAMVAGWRGVRIGRRLRPSL